MKRLGLGVLVLVSLGWVFSAWGAQVVWQVQRPNSLDENAFSDLGAVSVDRDGRIYVADAFNGIFVLDANGNLLDQIRLQNVSDISGLAIAADGSIWITDNIANKLLLVGVDGSIRQEIGGAGSGQFGDLAPLDLAIAPNGDLYVFDTQQDNAGNQVGRIQVFNSQGEFQRQFPTDPNQEGVRFLGKIALDANTNIYLADFWGGVAVLDSQGRLISSDILPQALRGMVVEALAMDRASNSLYVASEGVIYVLDSRGNLIDDFGASQAKGQFSAGAFYAAQGLAVAANGDVLVADTNYEFSQIVRIRF